MNQHGYVGDVIIENVMFINHPVAAAHIPVIGCENDGGIVPKSKFFYPFQHTAYGIIHLTGNFVVPGNHRGPVFPGHMIQSPTNGLLCLDIGLLFKIIVKTTPGFQRGRIHSTGKRKGRAAGEVGLG